MAILIIVAALLLVMGIIIIIGKGDNLIAGYNIKRLRGLTGGLLIVMAPMTALMLGEETMTAVWSFVGLTFFMCIIVVILANTWAKKKSK